MGGETTYSAERGAKFKNPCGSPSSKSILLIHPPAFRTFFAKVIVSSSKGSKWDDTNQSGGSCRKRSSGVYTGEIR